jgi:hypothetical protein
VDVTDVGLTTQHELVVRWTCSGCNQDTFVVKSLSDCWRECTEDEEEEPRFDEAAAFVSDEVFLRSMRVKWPG